MRRTVGVFAATGAVLLLLGGPLMGTERLPPGLPPSAILLLRYDANHDGSITREEMEAGLKADFAAADSDHDGCLSPAEVRAENERRLARDGAQASPLVDWNLDGCVDQREFGNTVRSYFDLADRTKGWPRLSGRAPWPFDADRAPDGGSEATDHRRRQRQWHRQRRQHKFGEYQRQAPSPSGPPGPQY